MSKTAVTKRLPDLVLLNSSKRHAFNALSLLDLKHMAQLTLKTIKYFEANLKLDSAGCFSTIS